MNIFEKLLRTTLQSSVGDNQESKPDDVVNTRKKLNALGLNAGDETRGLTDRDLDGAIRDFQTAANLKQDGLITPKGETENALNGALNIAKDVAPPLPSRKPDLTPLPQRKPMTPDEEKRRNKKLKKTASDGKKILDALIKRNPSGVILETMINSILNNYDNKNDPI